MLEIGDLTITICIRSAHEIEVIISLQGEKLSIFGINLQAQCFNYAQRKIHPLRSSKN